MIPSLTLRSSMNRASPAKNATDAGLLGVSAAETAAYTATTVLCQYLNRWENAGPAEIAIAEAAIAEALSYDPQPFLAYYAQGFLPPRQGPAPGRP